MSTSTSQQTTVIVDTTEKIVSLLNSLTNLPTNPPSLYVDLEGINLGRNGTISILSIHVLPLSTTYLIDVQTLQGSTFNTFASNRTTTTLKSILESPTIPKVFFDVRNDSDALFALYRISLDGVKDLQLMELASRTYSQTFLAGLGKCIENDGPFSPQAKQSWRERKSAFATGNQYYRFSTRPLTPQAISYCAQDVAFLPGLWNVYATKLVNAKQTFWRMMIKAGVRKRLALSRSARYKPQGPERARGPWDEYMVEREIESWNEEVVQAAMAGEEFPYAPILL
ncbi:domain-containing protein 1 [Halenospora varia]|nr:domain-containing protein 1 [Halenospora varia]